MDEVTQGSSNLAPIKNQPVESLAPVEKKSKKKYILIGIMVGVIILYVLARFIFHLSIVNKMQEELESSVSGMIRESRDELVLRENVTTIEEFRAIMQSNKEFLENRINNLETTGKDTAILKEIIRNCEEGGIMTREDEINHIRCVSNSSSSTGEYVNITTNRSSYWITNLFADTLLISLEEKVLGVLESEIPDINNNLEVSALTLEILVSIADSTILWAGLIPAVQEVYNNNGLEDHHPEVPPIEKDLKLEMPKIKRFANELSIPSREQIINIEFVDYCIKNMKEASKGSSIGMASKKSIFDWIFFTKTAKGICEEVENYQKREMLRLLTRTENEINPFSIIIGKTTLNIFIECSWHWGEERKDCPREFMDKLKEDFVNELS
tara:strand:+ start:1189 stop:2337 length:1149 start_codon:yes stop_codon:yes gene_type:complete